MLKRMSSRIPVGQTARVEFFITPIQIGYGIASPARVTYKGEDTSSRVGCSSYLTTFPGWILLDHSSGMHGTWPRAYHPGVAATCLSGLEKHVIMDECISFAMHLQMQVYRRQFLIEYMFAQVAYTTPLPLSIISPYQLRMREALRWVSVPVACLE